MLQTLPVFREERVFITKYQKRLHHSLLPKNWHFAHTCGHRSHLLYQKYKLNKLDRRIKKIVKQVHQLKKKPREKRKLGRF